MSDNFEQKLFQMAKREQMILPENLERKIDADLRNLSGRKKKKVMNWRRTLVLAAALTALFSLTATAAAGALRQRMEAMNRKKLEEYFSQIYTSRLSYDNYNRPYMESERKRMEQLSLSYQEEGLFPEGELTMLEEEEDYGGKNVAFLKTTGTFFFPDKEMSDEQLLQIIDFYARREYSLRKMNEMIAEGEMEFPETATPDVSDEPTDFSALPDKAAHEPGKALTIPYTGELSLYEIAAGNDGIFLAGRDVIHFMEIGSGDSVPFFDGFEEDTRITAMCQDTEGDVYVGLIKRKSDGDWYGEIWVLDENGGFLRKMDLASCVTSATVTLGGEKINGYIRQMMADENYLYLRGIGWKDADFLLITDKNGKTVSQMASGEYYADRGYGMCIGKDGKPYFAIRDKNQRLGIASINPKKGSLETVYTEIVPEDTVSLDLIAPGFDADFVLWGYSGSFSFNLSETAACQITPAYELPCPPEGSLRLVLPDGRIVFAYCPEYNRYRTEDGEERAERIPEKTCFYYLPGLRK